MGRRMIGSKKRSGRGPRQSTLNATTALVFRGSGLTFEMGCVPTLADSTPDMALA